MKLEFYSRPTRAIVENRPPLGNVVVGYRAEWRWRLRASNGRIVAASSEAFATRATARANLRRTYSAILKTWSWT